MELRGPRPNVKTAHDRRFLRVEDKVHVTGERGLPGEPRSIRTTHKDLAWEDNLVYDLSIRRRSSRIDAGFMTVDPTTQTVTLYGMSTSLELPSPEWFVEARRITAER